MFLPARMRKLRIITLDQYLDVTIKKLHENGAVEIQDISERIQQDPEWTQLLNTSKVKPITGKLSSQLMKTSGLIDFFDTTVPEEGTLKDKLMGFIKPEMPVVTDVDDLDAEALVTSSEQLITDVEKETRPLEVQLSDIDTQRNELETAIEVASKLEDFDTDLSLLEDTEHTVYLVGRVNAESYRKYSDEFQTVVDELALYEIPSESTETTTIVIATLKEHAEEVQTFLRKHSFEKFETTGLKGTPKQVIANSNVKIEELEKEKENVLKKVKVVSEKWLQPLLVQKEQLEIEKERNEIYASFGETKRTSIIEAWVPLNDLDEALETIEQSTEGNSVIDVETPSDTDETVPVKHENPRFARPYEFLSDMYGTLKYGELDPTIFLAIMFPFFFGYCLTDAFYGIIVALIGIILWKGMGKISDTMHSFGIIFTMCGIWTIVLGLLFNGFLGDLTARFFGYTLPTVIGSYDAFVHPDTILYTALAIGVLYLNIGMVIGAYNNIKYGDIKAAMGSQIVWFILEAGLVCLLLGALIFPGTMALMILGGVLCIATLVILIWANGFYGVMDIFSFLGNILSFARLLALCLATGGIAMTVNILVQMFTSPAAALIAAGPTGLEWILLIILIFIAAFLFIFGHIANMAFQVLGAFINALRLHYVEYFAQFWLGGKNKFESFYAKRIYTKLRR